MSFTPRDTEEKCCLNGSDSEDDDITNTYLAATMAILGGFANGYAANMGQTFIVNLKADHGGFSDIAGGVVIGSVFLGGAIGSPLGGWMCNARGRKLTAMLGEILILCGSMVALLSPNPWYVATLRFIIGIGVGICQAGKPIYVTELASAKYRGRVMAGFSLAFSAGIGAVRVMESLLKGESSAVRWRVNIIFGALPATCLLVFILLCVPESPIYLDLKNSKDEEKTRLNESDENTGAARLSDSLYVALERFWCSGRRQYEGPLLLAVVLMLTHQFVGVSILVLHTEDFIGKAGADHTSHSLILGVGIIHFCGSVVAILITDNINRRPQLLSGLIALAVLGIIMAVCLSAAQNTATIVTLYLYVAVFQSTVGPMFGVIITEIFPVDIRSLAIATIFALLFLETFLIQILYTATAGSKHEGTIAWSYIFSISALLALWTIHTKEVFPETNGIKLQEVDDIWNQGSSLDSSRGLASEGRPPLKNEEA